MLTLESFKKIPNGETFFKGEFLDNGYGINMFGSDRMLKAIAIKGWADDWCIYCGFANHDYDDITLNGDKVISEQNILKVVPCTDDVLARYRY